MVAARSCRTETLEPLALNVADPSKDPRISANTAVSGGLPGHAYRALVLAFLVGGLLVCRTAIGLTYYTPLGPGPGFFPFWAGGLLSLFCLMLLVQSFRAQIPAFDIPDKGPMLKIVVTIAAIACFGLFIERLGFVLTMFGVLLALLYVHGCRMLPTGLVVALTGSLGVGFAFSRWLGVFLPPAPGAVLQFIGL